MAHSTEHFRDLGRRAAKARNEGNEVLARVIYEEHRASREALDLPSDKDLASQLYLSAYFEERAC